MTTPQVPAPPLVARLRAALRQGPALRLAVLFGSHATGRARVGSDVDVGIIPAGAMSLREELAEASRLSGALGEEVDLVRLDCDEPLLGYEVARSGVCLFESDPGDFAAFRARAAAAWITFDEAVAPHAARLLERLRLAPPVGGSPR